MNIRLNPLQEMGFGYLSTLELPDHGFFGGYLLISPLGRPLEFHCTSPVRPSRAQQILYGPTLQPYLLGEQIGGTLIKRAELKPKILITDQPAMLCLRAQLNVPIVQLAIGFATSTDPSERLHSTASNQASSHCFALLGYDWEIPAGYETDHLEVEVHLSLLARHVDLAEPFGRIHEAIREAQRIGSQGTEPHAQAA